MKIVEVRKKQNQPTNPVSQAENELERCNRFAIFIICVTNVAVLMDSVVLFLMDSVFL